MLLCRLCRVRPIGPETYTEKRDPNAGAKIIGFFYFHNFRPEKSAPELNFFRKNIPKLFGTLPEACR